MDTREKAGAGLLTSYEAANYLRVSRATLFRWIGRRLLRRTKMGGVLRFRKTELDSLIERSTKEKR
jgi:excisionase family DNA binding protein